jgi:predicted transcriptional regulator
MAQRNLRLKDNVKQRIDLVASERGYRSTSAFMVQAIEEKLQRLEAVDSMSEAEARIAASFDQIMREVRSLHTSMQAQFALTDALTKYLLTCVIEPPSDLLQSARAKAKARYNRLMRAAAKTITGQVANSLYEGSTDEP